MVKKIISIKILIILIILLFIYFLNDIILNVPIFENPEVSIIIPVCNNFYYTYNCIYSIIKSETKIPYEIIIGNDRSTDKTKSIDKYIHNVRINNNNKEYGYLMNCNEAAKLTKGKYILFLNNDTKVYKNWLYYLKTLIESDSKIGMVGSMLIYPNGILQEAGGIIWKNGEGLNYGRGNNHKLPEYNYVKEVDYISGASILIRKDIWDIIGGFDKRYIPAYYEDTDLAFEVRKHGYKVMYQPKSIVVHYEGISNGKSITSGFKKYQVVNKEKFKDKWKKELKFQENNGNIFLARDRGLKNKRILVIDRFVPNFDKDAGSRCTYMYLKVFQKIGLQVTFIADDFNNPEPYTSILQQLGIEIIFGKWYSKNLNVWLKNNLNNFHYIYLQRPDITIKYIHFIRENFAGKIFYFAHDLQYIRLFRQYKINHDINYLNSSKYWEKIEMEIFSIVDVGYVVGDYEENILKKKFKEKPIRNIPLYIFENQLSYVEKDFSKRKDLIFVGGFSHYPNIDGVLWFYKKIYPNILKKYPNIIWHIVGSSIPIDIKKLGSKNIKIEGSLSDKDLYALYQKCRISIVPLRFGAGVKGKIVEAAYFQIPIVTTSIGAEGLDKSIGAFLIEDVPLKMSELINNLYLDYNKLKQISDSQKIFIEKYFSIERAKNILKMDI